MTSATPCTHAIATVVNGSALCAACNVAIPAGDVRRNLVAVSCRCGNTKFRACGNTGKVVCVECGEDLW